MLKIKDLENSTTGTSIPTGDLLDQLKFNDQGLIPAIAQQHDSGEVLMMAWMNRESIVETLQTGQVCYWSRSRRQFWRKGESSGNRQTLVSMATDCDADTLLLKVEQQGAACHTLRRSCFYLQIEQHQTEIINTELNKT